MRHTNIPTGMIKIFMYTKKKFDFEIDEELDNAIGRFLDALNTNDSCLDCYQDELNAEINNSLHYSLDEEQVRVVKQYYFHGGLEKEQGCLSEEEREKCVVKRPYKIKRIKYDD